MKKKRRKKTEITNSKDTNDLFAFGTLSGEVFIYSVKNGEVQAELVSQLNFHILRNKKFGFQNKGHTARVNSVCWSPDNKSIYSGSDDKYVIEWDISSGKVKRLVLPTIIS